MLRYYNIHFSVFSHNILICSIFFSFYSLLLSLFILPREFQLAAGHWTPAQGGFDDEDERFLSCPVTRFIYHHITRTLWFLSLFFYLQFGCHRCCFTIHIYMYASSVFSNFISVVRGRAPTPSTPPVPMV